MPLPLLARKSLQDRKADIDFRLAKISEAIGQTYTVAPEELESLYNALTAEEKSRNEFGAFYSHILAEFLNNIERSVKPDELVKKAWNEKVTKHTISFKHVPNSEWKIDLSSGSVVIVFLQVSKSGYLPEASFMDQLSFPKPPPTASGDVSGLNADFTAVVNEVWSKRVDTVTSQINSNTIEVQLEKSEKGGKKPEKWSLTIKNDVQPVVTSDSYTYPAHLVSAMFQHYFAAAGGSDLSALFKLWSTPTTTWPQASINQFCFAAMAYKNAAATKKWVSLGADAKKFPCIGDHNGVEYVLSVVRWQRLTFIISNQYRKNWEKLTSTNFVASESWVDGALILQKSGQLQVDVLALHDALYSNWGRNCISTLRVLLEDPYCKINGTDANGNTAIHAIIFTANLIANDNMRRRSQSENLEIFQLLLSKNPDCSIKNKDGKTALDYAVEYGLSAYIKLLEERSTKSAPPKAVSSESTKPKDTAIANPGEKDPKMELVEKALQRISVLLSGVAGKDPELNTILYQLSKLT